MYQKAGPQKAHLLIVDDEANTLASLARAFRLAGHEATLCDNAAKALELARAQTFDLILSDVVMPGKDGLSLHPGNPRGQTEAILLIIRRALEEAGFSMAEVVRTRMFVTDVANIEAVTTVHGEIFGDIRPAATVVVVAALIDPTLLVEIEVDARRS